jgi:hypothetical protein
MSIRSVRSFQEKNDNMLSENMVLSADNTMFQLIL